MDKTLGQIAYAAWHGTTAEHASRDWSEAKENDRSVARWERVAAAVAAAVKEEDARICEGMPIMFGKASLTSPDDCADAIRASIKEVK